MEWHPHTSVPEDYGKRTGTMVSVAIHVLALAGMIWASLAPSDADRPLNAMTVKLGGPLNLEPVGKARKAPVAGVVKRREVKPRPKPKPKKTTAPKKTVKKDNQIGLNRKKPKAAPPKKTENAEKAPVEREAETRPQPRETVSQQGARALGGIDGEEGTGVSMQVGDGSETVETDDVEFISYFRTVMAKVSSRWVKSGFRQGSASVRFHIGRRGGISNVQVVKSSGKSYLDGPAKRAVMGADLPPLPQGYEGEELIVTLNFHYGERR